MIQNDPIQEEADLDEFLGKDGLKVPHTFNASAWAGAFVLCAKVQPELVTDKAALRKWFSGALLAGFRKAERLHGVLPL